MKYTKLILAVSLVLAQSSVPSGQQPANQWPNYQHNSNYSPLTSITPENVKNLTTAWTFNYGAGSSPAGNLGLDYRFEVQPLLIGGVMYFSTPASPADPNFKSTITALEPETGKVVWQYTTPQRVHGRGLAYWPGNGTVGPRLYFGMDKGYLMSVDMKTGQPAKGFGDNGQIDVYVGVASPDVPASRRDTFTIPNPVSVYKNLIIAGARPGELGPPQPRGDIRAWDAVTGKQVWEFHVIPQSGEANFGTWPSTDLKDRSGANMWSTMTVDEPRNMIYAGLGDANRPGPEGKNLYTGSLVAIDARTGKMKWFHQLIHHDIWDFDMPTPPLLVDVRRNGRVIPAVFLTGKFNLVFMFNRDTGEPLYGLTERPVPRSDNPGSYSWPTQPFPDTPGVIGRVGMSRNDINKLTPEIEKYCTDFWDANKIQTSELYSVPLKSAGLVTFPSSVGGPNWGPLSYNPQLGYVFINLHNTGSFRAAGSPGRGEGGGPGGPGGGPGGDQAGRGGGRGPDGPPQGGGGGRGQRIGGQFSYLFPSGASMPCWAPPYGELVAVDVNTGKIAWKSTLGIQESLAADLGDKGVKTGTRNLGGSIATASGLVFIGATNDRRFRAFDAKTGAELWSATLPASAHSTPMTFMGKDGAQYVVVAASGGTSIGGGLPISDALVAFKLGAPAQATPPPAQTPGQGRGGQAQADPWPNSKKLLAVADVQSGFHHDSISHALATVEQIGRKANAYVTMIRTDSQLITKGQIVGKGRYEGRGVNARTLDYYDAIFMLPSGFGTMTEQQKKELLAFVHDEGKGLIVGHATGVAFTDWPEYAEMVGGYMDSEFNANAKIIVEDPAFPGATAFGGTTFMFNDQHPVFKAPYSRDKVHVIMRLDPDSLDATNRARRADGDFPVVWAKQYGKGRVFNVGWGHPDTTWDDPRFQQMMLEGIKWAMGISKADVTPKPFPGKAASPQDGELPEGPGKSAVLKICGECHAVEQAVSIRGSEKDWKDAIELMIDRGATGSEDEFKSILTYLTKNYGPR